MLLILILPVLILLRFHSLCVPLFIGLLGSSLSFGSALLPLLLAMTRVPNWYHLHALHFRVPLFSARATSPALTEKADFGNFLWHLPLH